MGNRIDRNRASAARIALILDEIAGRAEDVSLMIRIVRLKNLALGSRTDSRFARRADRRTLRAARRLSREIAGRGETWTLLGSLSEIEDGLYDRERTVLREDVLTQRKRRLFTLLRSQASEMDQLAHRRRQLDESPVSGAAEMLRREELDALGRRFSLLTASFEQTRRALRAMDSVSLLRSEEAGLAALERDCALLPDSETFAMQQDRLELRREALDRR